MKKNVKENNDSENVVYQSVNDFPMTDEMKYIKWPTPLEALQKFFAIALGSVIVCMLIAATDDIGKMIIGLFV